jgi:penicillin-binding protein 1A
MKRILLSIALIGASLALLMVSWGVMKWSWANSVAGDVPMADQLPQRLEVRTADGHLLDELGPHRRIVRLDELPEHVVMAFVAAEDGQFRSHPGVDPVAIVRAAVTNFRAGRVTQGGSTLTQQVVKQTAVGDERSLSRKVDEAFVALALERHRSKDEILETYLNLVYLGRGAYGVEAAARHYFGRSAHELSLAEAVTLASVVPAPSRYGPDKGVAESLGRRDEVLDRMVDLGAITMDEAVEARVETVHLQEWLEPERVAYGQAFRTHVRRHLEQAGLTESLLRAGGTLHTSLRGDAQRVAEEAVRLAVAGVHRREPTPAGEELPKVQAAAVVIDNDSGHLVALVGGTDDELESFVRATQARRQPGSAFKPFVYAAALDAGATQLDEALDLPISLPSGTGRWWSPANYAHSYRGPIDLRTALAVSSNVVAVRTAADVGMPAVIDVAQRLGIESPLGRDLTTVLGSSGVTPLEITGAYAAIARGGEWIEPVSVTGLTTERGEWIGPGQALPEPLEASLPAAAHREALDEGVAAELRDMLAAVVERGTGRRAFRPHEERMGKTGTTNDYHDAWFVGATPDLTIGVWVGRDDHEPLGDRETGGRAALPAWILTADALSDATEASPRRFPMSPRARWVHRGWGVPVVVARGRDIDGDDALADLGPLELP